MAEPLLQKFILVGGTALSLQIGHRISIDIDLFSQEPFNEQDIAETFISKYGLQIDYLRPHTIKGEINGTKVDILTHTYPLVNTINIQETIRLANLQDIAAMKLNAITVNGTRIKDFIDIAYLSSYLSMNEILEAYRHKYSAYNTIMAVKSLLYQEDINFNEPVRMVKETLDYALIKSRINEMIKNPDKKFPAISIGNLSSGATSF